MLLLILWDGIDTLIGGCWVRYVYGIYVCWFWVVLEQWLACIDCLCLILGVGIV